MTREEQRAELYRGIEKIAHDLRGSVDGWDFKQYVFGFMFYRYISEKLANLVNQGEHDSGDLEFDYVELTDEEAEEIREDIVETIGYFILPSELFVNVAKNAKNNDELNIKLAEIFKNIETSTLGTPAEANFKGLLDDVNVNSNKLGGTVKERNEALLKLLDSIGGIDFGKYSDTIIDPFGDAYEALMGMYARNAGRSGGEYFTPQEVSKLLTEICFHGQENVNKVYDPTCGSGSLLLQSLKKVKEMNNELEKDSLENPVVPVNQTIQLHGQEKNITTYNLCRMNMLLHNVNYSDFKITHGDTLLEFKNESDEPFDIIVSNPPYSVKWDGDSNPLLINDPRYSPAGVLAPRSKADLAFVMHILHALSDTGTAAVVSFPGVMYRTSPKAEQQIRKYLVDNNFVEAIINLPEDLFYGTGIQTNIMVLKKNKTETKTLFLNVEKEFIRVTNSNKLSDENIENILKYYKDKKDVAHISKLVDNEIIAENDYNLSVSMYVEKEDLREKINIKELNSELKQTVDNIDNLRKEIEIIIAEIEGGENDDQ